MRARSTNLKLAVLVVAAALAVGYAAGVPARGQDAGPVGDRDGPQAGEEALPVAVHTVRLQDHYEVKRAFTGRVTARRTADLGFDRGGIVADVRVDDGNRATKGTVLAKMDTDRLVAERTRLQAERAEVEANLKLARRTRERTRELVREGHQSEQRLDEDDAQVDRLVASLARVDAAIAANEVELDKALLIAPFDGMVQQRLIDEGTAVAAGQPVLQFLETGTLEARVGLPYDFGRRIEEGAPFRIIGPHDEPMPAKLVTITPGIRGETRTVLATVSLGARQALRVTDGALITLVMADRIEQTGFWTPVRSLSADIRGLWRIYKLVPDEATPSGYRVAFEHVQLVYAEDDRAFVTGSVSNGDMIIAEGPDRVAPGKLVRPVQNAES